MTTEQKQLLDRRKRDFPAFYEQLIPSLVDFVSKMGINPAHEVLNNAPRFVPLLSTALRNLDVVDEEDKAWLLARLGYFIGEYFTQKYSGAWYPNENPASRYFARYVVGKFSIASQRELNLDPFMIAEAYISIPMPRALEPLLQEAEQELIGSA